MRGVRGAGLIAAVFFGLWSAPFGAAPAQEPSAPVAEATATVATVPTSSPAAPTAPPTIESSPTEVPPPATVAWTATTTPSIALPSVTPRRPSRTPSPTPTKVNVHAAQRFDGESRSPGLGRNVLTPFAGGAIAVLLGVALGLAATALAAGSRRRNARRGAATAMLAELRWIDAVLRKVADRGSSAADLSLDHPIVSANLRDLALFEPETAGRIADLHYHVRAVEQEMQRYRENPRAWVGRLPELDGLIRQKAISACRLIPKLSEALQKEGGALPPATPARDDADREAVLPTSPFGEGESDDWTL